MNIHFGLAVPKSLIEILIEPSTNFGYLLEYA